MLTSLLEKLIESLRVPLQTPLAIDSSRGGVERPRLVAQDIRESSSFRCSKRAPEQTPESLLYRRVKSAVVVGKSILPLEVSIKYVFFHLPPVIRCVLWDCTTKTADGGHVAEQGIHGATRHIPPR